MRHVGMALARACRALHVATALLAASAIMTGAAQASSGHLSFLPRVDFGNQLVNTNSPTLTIVVTNTGDAAVKVARADLTNAVDFYGYCPCLGVTLAPGESFAGTITFTPHAIGTLTGTIVISTDGGPQIIELVGVAYPAGAPPATDSAIEYHHASFDHYFVTAVADEVVKLDKGVFAGWTRTGQSFKVYPSAQPGLASVCRFFSTAFAPKSSHFYTPDAHECATVQANADWQFEAVVFFTTFADPAGECPSATAPIYRLYNNGQGAAPNHRYTTSLAIRAQMLDAGWVSEGYGAIGVIMCAAT